MKNASLLTSTALGCALGAAVFGATPALSQLAVIDFTSIAIQQALQGLQQQVNNTLTSITGQLSSTGPLATLLGSSNYGSVTQLLRDGFTQNANYAKGTVSAQRQIADASNLAMTRVERDFRNAQIRDEHTPSSPACAAADNGQTVTVGARESWKVAKAIQKVADERSEAGPNQPAHFGTAQAIQAINYLHFSRYCSEDEDAAGLCQAQPAERRNADQRADSLFGTGTFDDQDGINAANDYITHLVQPIVPAALRGDQITSINGAEALARRRQYNAQMSLARSVLNDAVAAQSPSVPLTAAQKEQLENAGLPTADRGSWLQALTLDVHRRYSDIDWAAKLQAMPPAAVQREIALELAATNYLLLQNYKIALRNATVNATQLAAAVDKNFEPAVEMPTPSIGNN
jgi:hypothetical protein